MQTFRLTAMFIVLFAGCHHAESTFSARLVPDATFCTAEYATVWEASKNVLRRHYFRLDATDARAGRITTYPEISPHFFEFWRTGRAAPRDAWESSVASIRHRAVIEIDRAPDGAGCRIVATVRKERLSTPERQMSNSAGAIHFLSTRLPTERTGRAVGADPARWIDLGRDPAMEDALRGEIARQVATSDDGAAPSGAKSR